MKKRFIPLSLVICNMFVLIYNINAQTKPSQSRGMIRPSLIHVEPGEKMPFKIVIKASRMNAATNPEKIVWKVNDVVGGNKQYGTISQDGVYKAPATMPHPREIHISGTTDEAQNSVIYATVIVGAAPLRYKSTLTWSKPLKDAELNLNAPHGFGLDIDGNVMVTDENSDKVLRFTAKGQFLNEIGKGAGEKPGYFKSPKEVRSDPSGNIYVTDMKGDKPRVQVFNNKGELINIFAEKGRGPGQLLRGHGIGFGPNNTLFIVDVDNMRVNVYERTGKFLYDFSSWSPYKNSNPAEMNASHGVFVDQNGDAFVNSYYGPTHKFSPEGDVIAEFAHGDPPNGSVYFHNITGDRWGNVYIMARPKDGAQKSLSANEHSISVIKYNNNGDFITQWSYSDPKHRETTAAVDNNGVFHAMYVTSKEMIIEIFNEE